MSKVSEKTLGSAVRKTYDMGLAEKESVLDNVYQEQPNLLASVLVLQKFGVSLEKMDVLLNILITLHLAFKESGCFVPKITEHHLERQLILFTSVVKFSEGTGEENIRNSIGQYISSHRENVLFAYVVKELEKANMFNISNDGEKNAVLSGINLVNCLASAESQA